jgi:polyisoprenyl-teichoic acid--peptidoglycan teichoic acid transferase
MRYFTGLAVLLFTLLLTAGCSPPQVDVVEARALTPLFFQHPPEFASPTPFLPTTFTPLPPVRVTNSLPPPPTPTHFPTPAPSPSLTPSPVWDQVEWPAPSTPASVPIPPPMDLVTNGEVVNFLLLGSDRRPAGTAFRTDTIILASVRTKDNTVSLISIPRDLYVYIPGWTMNRINTAYFYGERTKHPGGGPALLKDTILYNLGVHIDHTVFVEFDGFRKIIDTLGGVDVPLVCEFTDWRIIDPEESDQDPDNWELHTIGPGIIHMDGEMSLWYARARLRSSDYDRGRRQQELVRAMFSRGMQLNLILKIPALYSQIRDIVQTDMGLDGILDLVPISRHLKAPNLRSYYITSKMVRGYRTPEGASVLLPDNDAIRVMLEGAFSAPSPDIQERLGVRVEIWNGTGKTQWDILAAERLHYAGYQTNINKADRLDYDKSIVYDFTLEQDHEKSSSLLQVLGLPASALRAAPGENPGYAYRLITGANYNPCFNPTR